MNRSRFRKVAVRSSWVVVAFFVMYFLFRSVLLDFIVSRVAMKVKDRTGMEISVRDKGYFGFSGVWMSGLTVVQTGKDTLLRIDTFAVRPMLLPLLIGRVGVDYLFLQHAFLQLCDRDGIRNFSFHRDSAASIIKKDTTNKADAPGYGSLLRHLLIQSFSLAPQEAHLSDLRLDIHSDTLQASFQIPQFDSDKKALKGSMVDLSNGMSWKMEGVFSQRHRSFDLEVHPMQQDRRLPLIGSLLGATVGFDTLKLSLAGMEYGSGELTLAGAIAAKGFSVFHSKIADDTVRVDSASFDYQVSIKDRSIRLDSASTARLNRMVLHPYVAIDREGKDHYSLVLKIDTVPADDFFQSLPQGMFDEVRSIRGTGRLAFRLDFDLNTSEPDKVKFDCSMSRIGFKLKSSGSTDIFKLNNEFVYDVFEKGKYIRSFPVGPSNPQYTPIDQVAPAFRNSVLTSEDGNFFFHNGFNEEAFRKSIAENYKAGKFKRGGSTITMQLVKNVFLTRKKTIARKAEEALIVWLIESGRLVSKNRMLEVYFNIIELGPDVYGIGEASGFYFNKRPSELNLAEGIYLAGLLPRPKGFRSSFDSTGVLKPHMADYYRVMSNFMLRKGLITQEEHDVLKPDVTLTGPARDLVMPEDTTGEEPFLEQ